MSWFKQAPQWFVHNPMKEWTLCDLTDRECSLLIATLSLAEKRSLLLWRKDLPSWVGLDHAESQKIPTVDLTKAPSVPLPMLPQEEPHDEITAVRSHHKQSLVVPREFLRIDMKLSAEVIGANQSHQLTTDNVSEGGIKFTERLPDWVAGYFTVVLQTSERSFELTCMLVEDQRQDKTRVAVVETNDEESHLPLYKKWIRSIIDSSTSAQG